MKTSARRDGTLKNQPNKMRTTPQHIYTIPTSCATLLTMHNKKLSTHSINEHGTQHCSLHSLPHKRQSIPATFSSNKISQHNLNSQHTIQTHHCSQFLHARQTIPATLSSNYIASIHNITHYPCTSICTTHPAIPSQLPSITLLCSQRTNTKHSWQNDTRCRNGVNVLWCRSHLVWLVFEGSIPTCACFHSENFFVTFTIVEPHLSEPQIYIRLVCWISGAFYLTPTMCTYRAK